MLNSLITGSLFVLIVGTCATKVQGQPKKKFVQGVCLTVRWYEGNHMPGPDQPRQQGRLVDRELWIYAVTSMSQVTQTPEGFYENIKSRLVRRVRTGPDGRVCVSLPEGEYSVFTKEEKGLYANLFDAENNIFPVRVQRRKITQAQFDISYQAVY